MRIENVLALTDAKLLNSPVVELFDALSLDAHKVRRGDLFLAFNPDDIALAVTNGAYGVLVDNATNIIDPEIAWIEVQDLQRALEKLLRFRFIEKNVSAYACEEITLALADKIITTPDIVVLNESLQEMYKTLWDITEGASVLFSPSLHSSDIFVSPIAIEKVKKPLLKVLQKRLFESSFIYEKSFYEKMAISPLFLPQLETLLQLFESLQIESNLHKLSYIKHFEPVFIDKNARVKEFGSSDKVVIFEPNIKLLIKEVNFLQSDANWAKIIYLLPRPIAGFDDENIFIYESLDTITDILRDTQFNFALVGGTDSSILEMQEESKKQLTLAF